jgi:cytochrome c-type biogenesis protein CcmH
VRRVLQSICLAALLAATLGGAPAAWAVRPDEMLSDPALEARARDISHGLRCLVCQNQSIDDSDADLARDLRLLVRERLVAGDSDAEIVGFLTARYGDFVLLKPPVKPATWGLWFGPALVLVMAAAGLVVYVRARAGRPDHRPPDLNPEERRRLEALLNEEPGPSRSA